MALRYAFPNFAVSPSKHPSDPDRYVPRLRPPAKVEFRGLNEKDVTDVLAAIDGNDVTEVVAAVGSGKSTRMPSLLAQRSGELVLHVVPSDKLAWHLYDYVSQAVAPGLGVATQFVQDLETPLIESGVVFMNSTCLVARMIGDSAGSATRHILVQDEWHASDGCTYALRETASSLPSVKGTVLASATADPAGFRKRVASAPLQVKKFAQRAPATWDPTDEGVPWCVDEIRDHTMIFIDRDDVAARLQAGYIAGGLVVFRLNSRSTVRDFQKAQEVLLAGRCIVVLLVDSSFRDGFTLPVSVVIDSGEVAYNNVIEGCLIKQYRAAYAGEMEQASGRAARIPGLAGVAWSPMFTPEQKMITLEGVESEAAALLLRFLGFKPGATLRDASFKSGAVPRDLVTALNSTRPLTDLRAEELDEWPGTRERQLKRIQTINAALAAAEEDTRRLQGAGGLTGGETEKPPLLTRVQTDQLVQVGETGAVPIADGLNQVLQSMSDTAGVKFEPGKYYYHGLVQCAPDGCSAFPLGLVSVVRFVSQDDYEALVPELMASHKAYLVAVLLDAYNCSVLSLNSLTAVVHALQSDGPRLRAVVDEAALRLWLAGLAEDLTSITTRLTLYARVLQVAVGSGFVPLSGFENKEADMAAERMQSLLEQVKPKQEGAVSRYAERLRLEGGPHMHTAVSSPGSYNGRLLEGRFNRRDLDYDRRLLYYRREVVEYEKSSPVKEVFSKMLAKVTPSRGT